MRCRSSCALTVVFAVTLITGCALREHTIEVIDIVESPGADYKAVIYTDMGGGAAGWCHTYVEVLQAASSFREGVFSVGDEENRERVRRSVFRHSDCWAALKLTWIGPESLHIDFPVYGLYEVGVDLKSQPRAVDVQMSYSVTTGRLRKVVTPGEAAQQAP